MAKIVEHSARVRHERLYPGVDGAFLLCHGLRRPSLHQHDSGSRRAGSRRLVYWDEAQVDHYLFNPSVGDRKATSAEGLRAAVPVSRIGHPAIRVRIAEGREEMVREIWQESHSPTPNSIDA